MCFMHESPRHPMPSRTSQESYRPRVSNRTMVANLANRHACPLQERWRRHDREHETRWDVRDQISRPRARNRTAGLDEARITAPSGGGEELSLDIPFYRTS